MIFVVSAAVGGLRFVLSLVLPHCQAPGAPQKEEELTVAQFFAILRDSRCWDLRLRDRTPARGGGVGFRVCRLVRLLLLAEGRPKAASDRGPARRMVPRGRRRDLRGWRRLSSAALRA